MKYSYYILPLLLIPLVSSCGKDVVYELPDAEEYTNVYMLQAVDTPRDVSLFMLEDVVQTTSYSAYYSGLKAPKDINITFSVDPALVDTYNEANQTEFELLPEECYTLEATEAVIPKGDCRTPMMKISINTFGYIEAFKDYLLPVTMNTTDARMNPSLTTTYFYVTGSYAPGQIPCRLVNDNFIAPKEIFAYNDVCLMARSTDGTTLRRYGYNSTTEEFDAPTVLRTDYTATHPRLFSWGGANHVMAVNQYNTLISVPAAADGTTVGGMGDYDGVLTGGFDAFNLMVWTAHPDGVLGRLGGSGQMNFYKTTPAWTALDLSVITFNTFNWGNYRIVFCYGKDLMGIDNNGDLWFHAFDTATSTFSTTGVKKGSGWDMYTHVTPFGSKLLGLDITGSLWEYDFDMRGFWALKAIE